MKGGVKDTWGFHKNFLECFSLFKMRELEQFRIFELLYLLVSLNIYHSPSPLVFRILMTLLTISQLSFF